jgi:hypothetical protein
VSRSDVVGHRAIVDADRIPIAGTDQMAFFSRTCATC